MIYLGFKTSDTITLMLTELIPGFKELQALKNIDKLPRMVGVQAHGCALIAEAYLKNESKPVTILKPSTHALGILVRNPLNGKAALRTIKESKGTVITVQDSEIFAAEQEIARLEGMFAEPSSSATIAALKKLVYQGVIDKEDTVVCLITGSGLKATDVLQALAKKRKMHACKFLIV